jgi:CRP-like cAMP-binding protein
MISLVKTYPSVAMNVISFLAKRVEFLNDKITTFSGKNTAQKIASHLLTQYSKYGAIIPFCGTKISSAVSIGRASLYRVLTSLENEGIVKLDQKQIIIISPDGLERISK